MNNAFIFAAALEQIPVLRLGESVAQLVEHYTFNVRALGSNPSGFTSKTKTAHRKVGGFYFSGRRQSLLCRLPEK